MHKGTPQVAKSASKVGKRGSKWAQFHPFGLTFDADFAIFGLPWRILPTIKRLFSVFVQYL